MGRKLVMVTCVKCGALVPSTTSAKITCNSCKKR